MLDFLAYKYQVHHYTKVRVLPGKGALVRLESPQMASQVVAEYQQYYNPKPLRAALELIQENSFTAEGQAAQDGDSREQIGDNSSVGSDECSKRTASYASEEGSTDSVGPQGSGFSWADEMDAHITDLPDDLAELTPEVTSPSLSDAEGAFPNIPPALDYETYYQGEKNGEYGGRGYPTSRHGNSGYQGGFGHRRKGGHQHTCHTEWGESCTDAVLRILQTDEAARKNFATGWEALRIIWNFGPENLDHAVLTCLNTKSPRQQEHILLSFAAIDLSYVHNLSAYLNCLIKEHDTTNQVCLYFLAGLCTCEDCWWVHPVNTRGWIALRDTWNITYKDLDYTVLNFLSKKTIREQDDILSSLADMDLRVIHNLPAYLSSMIQKYDGTPRYNKPGRNRRQSSFGKRDRDYRPRGPDGPASPESVGMHHWGSTAPYYCYSPSHQPVVSPPWYPVPMHLPPPVMCYEGGAEY